MDIALILITAALSSGGILMIISAAAWVAQNRSHAQVSEIGKTCILVSFGLLMLAMTAAMAVQSFGSGYTLSPSQRQLFLIGPGVSWGGFFAAFVLGGIATVGRPRAGEPARTRPAVVASLLFSLALLTLATVAVYMNFFARLYQWRSLYAFSQGSTGTGLIIASVIVLIYLRLRSGMHKDMHTT